MWDYIGAGDPSTVANDIMPEESMTNMVWLVLGSTTREPVVDGGPSLFLVYEPRPCDLPSLVSVAPSPRGPEREEGDPRGASPPSEGMSPGVFLGESPSSRATGKRPCLSSSGAVLPQ